MAGLILKKEANQSMQNRFKIDIQVATELVHYLQNAIISDVKTIDTVKEFMIAKQVQSVQFKLETILLRQRISPGKVNTIQLSELEVLALNVYFSRYQLISYLLPVEQQVMEIMRKCYPDLLKIIAP